MPTPEEAENPLAAIADDARAARLAGTDTPHHGHELRLRRLERRATLLTLLCATLVGLLVAEAAGLGLLVPRSELAALRVRIAAAEAREAARTEAARVQEPEQESTLREARDNSRYLFRQHQSLVEENVQLKRRTEELEARTRELERRAREK